MSSTYLLLGTAAGLEGGSGFSIADDMPGIKLWSRGDAAGDRTIDAGKFTRWGQLSFEELVQAVVAKKFLEITDAARIDGIDDIESSENTISLTTFVAWMAFKNSDTAANAILVEHGPRSTTDDGFSFNLVGASDDLAIRVRKGGTVLTRTKTIPDLFDGSKNLARVEYNGTEASLDTWVNDVKQNMSLTVSGEPGSGAVNDTLNVGARAAPSLFFNGDLFELLVVSPYPTAGQIAGAEAEIKARTGTP